MSADGRLGPRKLRQLAERTGLPLEAALVWNHYVDGRVIAADGRCQHYWIDRRTGEHEMDTDPFHWSTCPRGD